MDPKLDCQRLRHYLSKYIFVDSSLSSNIVSQNHLKIEDPKIGNTCYGCQNLRTRCHLQGETPKGVGIIHINTPFMNILGGSVVKLDILQVPEPISTTTPE